MEKTELNDDVNMNFSASGDWHHDLWLPADAQVTEIHLRVYSFAFPNNIYGIRWNSIQKKGARLHIPIDAFKIGHSAKNETVHLAFDVTFYSDALSPSPQNEGYILGSI